VNIDLANAEVVADRPTGSRDRLGELWLLVLVLILPLLALTVIGRAEHAPSKALLDHINSVPHIWPASELRDRVAYVVVLLLAAGGLSLTLIMSGPLLGGFGFKPPSGRLWRTLPATAGSIGLAAGLVVRDQRLQGSYFSGFSVFDLLCVTVVVVMVLAPRDYRRAVWAVPFARRATYALAVVLLFWRILPLIQWPRSVLDPYHTYFVLNELLSVVGGRFPGFDFVSQYTSGLGYGFWAFNWLVPLDVFDSVFLFITLLNALVVGSVIGVIRWAWRRTAAWLWVAVVCSSAATFTVAPGLSGDSSATHYFANMPIRQIGFAATLVGIVAVVTMTNRIATASLLGGVAAALGIAANLESGLAALVAIAVVRIFFRHERLPRTVLHLLLVGLPTLGMAGGLVIAQQLTESQCDIDCTWEFARIFGAVGYFSADMPMFGFHTVVFAGHVLAAVVAGRAAMRHVARWRVGSTEFLSGNDLSTVRVAAVTVGSAVFGLVELSYYVNRSYAALLLVVFLPLSVSSMGMLTLLVRESTQHTLAEQLFLVPLVGLAVVPMLAVPRLPALEVEWSRLSGDLPAWIYPFETEFPVIDSVLHEAEARFGATPDDVGIVASNMMVGPVRYGMRAGLSYNSPLSIVAHRQAERQCGILRNDGPKVLLVHPQGLYQELNPIFECAGYREHSVIDGGYVAFVREENYP